MYKKRISAVLMLLCLLIGLKTAYAEETLGESGDRVASSRFTGYYPKSESNAQFVISEAFSLISENEEAALYVRQDTLAIRVKNKKTGYIWSSDVEQLEKERLNSRWKNYFRSGIVIEYNQPSASKGVNLSEESILTSAATSVKLERISNGFMANVVFGESKISLSFSVTLVGRQLEVKLDDKNIEEKGKNKLITVAFFPTLGSTKSGEQDGYFFLPDGDGALANYQTVYTNVNQNYAKAYYGSDVGVSGMVRNWRGLTFPLYGIIHGVKSNGLMVHSIEASEHAELVMYPAGVRTDYYFITNRYIYRNVYTHLVTTEKHVDMIMPERKHFNIHEEITLLSDHEADYTGIAQTYSAHLKRTGQLSEVKSGQQIPLNLNILAAATKPGFFSGKTVPMTTLKQTNEIIEKLTVDGVNRLNLSYNQATEDALSLNVKDRFTLRKDLGRISEIKALQDQLEKNGSTLSLELNSQYIDGKYTGLNMMQDILRGYNAQFLTMQHNIGAKNVSRYWINQAGFEELMRNDLDQLKRFGLVNARLSLPLPSSSYNDQEVGRSEAIDQIAQTFSAFAADMDYVGVSRQDYIPAYTSAIDALFDMEMSTTLYPYITDTVPFTSILLKGHVDLFSSSLNMSGNPDEMILRMIEWGVYPSYIVTYESPSKMYYTDTGWAVSTEFKQWNSDIVSKYKQLNDKLAKTIGATINNHEVISAGLVRVTYNNGVRVIVNYTDSVKKVDGREIAPMDSEVIQG